MIELFFLKFSFWEIKSILYKGKKTDCTEFLEIVNYIFLSTTQYNFTEKKLSLHYRKTDISIFYSSIYNTYQVTDNNT